jgi:hypothetical protein
MPTANQKPVKLNGKAAEAMNKHKLDEDFDWQAIVRVKRKELKEKKDKEKAKKKP